MGWSFSAQHPGSPVRAEKERMVLIGVYASPCGMGKVWDSNSLFPLQHSTDWSPVPGNMCALGMRK